MYYIRKASRGTATQPYTGPTCNSAGIEPGLWYATREEAEADAAKLAEHNAVGFKVEFKFNGSLPNLFQGFTVDQWFSHHPPRTEARKVEHEKVDRAIRTLAEELLMGKYGDVVKESAAQECTAEIRTTQALPITIEWAAYYIDEAREAMYIAENKARIEETISRLSQARQTLHQGIALLELQQLGEANPEEVRLREEVRGGSHWEKAAAFDGMADAATDLAVVLEDRHNEIQALEARIAELEERLKEPDEDAEAYTKELEDRLERLGDQDETQKGYIDELEGEVASLSELRYQVNFLSSVLADMSPSPEIWSRIAATFGAMKKEAE
jgi:hypothetical protein